MKPEILNCKELEYSVRLATAIYRGNQDCIRKKALAHVIILRQCARAAHKRYMDLRQDLRGLERAVRKSEADGVSCVFSKMVLDRRRKECDKAEAALAKAGEELLYALDLWQTVGATFEDLCNLCNRDPAQVRGELLESEDTADSFSKLAMVHNLDYKNPRDTGWLEDSVDAPLTHALKAYLLDRMLHTEEGRKAAHEAMETVFPEIMENAYTEVTDENGVRRLYDKDGEEVGILGDEDDEPPQA